jgi:hypothetical protein
MSLFKKIKATKTYEQYQLFYEFYDDTKTVFGPREYHPITYYTFFNDLIRSAKFRLEFNRVLKKCKFKQFRLMTNDVTYNTLKTTPLTFILEKFKKDLGKPDTTTFDFSPCSRKKRAMSFVSKSGNYLVAPCINKKYPKRRDLGEFVRTAPPRDIHHLWQAVGETAMNYKNKPDQTFRVNTHGSSIAVSWLHVRFDLKPEPKRYHTIIKKKLKKLGELKKKIFTLQTNIQNKTHHNKWRL